MILNHPNVHSNSKKNKKTSNKYFRLYDLEGCKAIVHYFFLSLPAVLAKVWAVNFKLIQIIFFIPVSILYVFLTLCT